MSGPVTSIRWRPGLLPRLVAHAQGEAITVTEAVHRMVEAGLADPHRRSTIATLLAEIEADCRAGEAELARTRQERDEARALLEAARAKAGAV